MKNIILGFLLFLVTIGNAQFKIVKKITVTKVASKKVLFFNKKVKRKCFFTEYNKAGQEITFGYYGEYKSFQSKRKADDDSIYTITWYESVLYKNIDYEDFSFYDSLNHRLTRKETWYYKDNKKSWLGSVTRYLYNVKGKLAQETTVDDSNKAEKAIMYLYDERGNKIKEIDSDYILNPLHPYSTINKFDSMNRIIQSCEYEENKCTLKKIYLYSGKDSNITWVFRYDEVKNDTTLKLWSISNTTYGYIFYSKDDVYPIPSDWRTLEETSMAMDYGLIERSVYIYKKNGLLDKVINKQGDYDKYTYEFY